MWWLQLFGLVAFAVLIVSGFVALRRGEVYGRRSTLAALLVAGTLLIAAGVYALIATA